MYLTNQSVNLIIMAICLLGHIDSHCIGMKIVLYMYLQKKNFFKKPFDRIDVVTKILFDSCDLFVLRVYQLYKLNRLDRVLHIFGAYLGRYS